MTYKTIYEKYFNNYADRNEMPQSVERSYVSDCFKCCEESGFKEKFDSPYSTLSKNVSVDKYKNKPFTVIRRCTEEDGFDLECLPAWEIKFENGYKTFAYPEEICV